MSTCFLCSLVITRSECHYQKNIFHAECCKICLPPPPPPKEKVIPKAKAGPGRLNFQQIGSFESKGQTVNCATCKKKIDGQKYLTHKVGEFNCKSCHAKIAETCFVCKELFESGEEVFKNDEGQKYCEKCMKLYLEEKKAKVVEKPIVKITHCDKCTDSIDALDIHENKGFKYHIKCYHSCTSCKKDLKDKKSYKDENDNLFCEKCFEKFCPPCEKCKTGVLPDKRLSFEDKCYHIECFSCCKCSTKIATDGGKVDSDNKKFYKDDKNLPYCIDCYGKHCCKQCSNKQCSKAILPNQTGVAFENKNYHAECFKCCKCTKKIAVNNGDKVFKGGDSSDPYCLDCFGKYICPQCVQCKSGIMPGQQGLSFEGKIYHRTCFKCNKCSKELSSNGKDKIAADNDKFFKGENNMPYCIDCYGKYMCKQCEKCKTGILSLGLSFENKNYHKECFCCNNCSKKIAADSDQITADNCKFYKGNKGEPLCLECYGNLLCAKCEKCKSPVLPSQGGIKFEDQTYHGECFTCFCCSTKLASGDTKDKKESIKADNKSFFKGEKNHPYCIDCYGKNFCKKCETCKNPVLPNQKGIIFEGMSYHADKDNFHFCCIKCSIKLDADGDKLNADNKKFFKGENNHPYCPECYAKYMCKKCVCGNGILPSEKMVTFEDQTFHLEHFCCTSCHIKLPGAIGGEKLKADFKKLFKGDKNEPYCLSCFAKRCASCEKCDKPIFPNQNLLALDERNFHKECISRCSKCAKSIIFDTEKFTFEGKNILCQKCSKPKEKSPSRGKAGPGKLNFGKISGFENTDNINCNKCKKKIVGEKFLTNKVGAYICKDCNSINEQTCYVCKKSFESREEFFKDDKNNNYCEKCFKEHKKSTKSS